MTCVLSKWVVETDRVAGQGRPRRQRRQPAQVIQGITGPHNKSRSFQLVAWSDDQCIILPFASELDPVLGLAVAWKLAVARKSVSLVPATIDFSGALVRGR